MIANFIMAGLNVLGGFGQSKTNQKLAKAQYKLDSTRADIKEWTTASANMMAMADASNRDFEMRRQNKKKLEAYGEQVSQEAWNASNQADKMNSSRFESRLQNMGNLGSLAAAAAAAGVGGSSVTAVADAENLRQSRIEKQASRDMADWQYARNLNQTSMMDNALNSLDLSAGNFANLTYSTRDMVTDNSWQHKWSIGKGLMDGASGFMGNMDKLGLDVSALTGKAAGETASSLFKQATGALNKGLGGATRL